MIEMYMREGCAIWGWGGGEKDEELQAETNSYAGVLT